MVENAKDKQIFINEINGFLDHVHCLISLNADTSVSKTIQLIKGESAFWANKNNLVNPKLEWANDYFAVSVSESMKDKVKEYIRNQEEHHKKITFDQEYQQFIAKYGFERKHG